MTDLMDESPITGPPDQTGLNELDRLDAMEAKLLTLQALVRMLVERDAESHADAEEYVDKEAASIFWRLMQSEGFELASEDVLHAAEAMAFNLLRGIGLEKMRREAN